jgi:hypothetical protein
MTAITGLLELLRRLVRIGVLPSDSDEDRLRKSTLVRGAILITLITPIWVTIYAVHDLWLSARCH